MSPVKYQELHNYLTNSSYPPGISEKFSIYNRQGAPVEIISDNGREFINSIMKTLQNTYNCKMLLSAPYHPQTNGLDESSNKTIKRYLMKMLSTKQENWHYFLEQVVFLLIFERDQQLAFQLLN